MMALLPRLTTYMYSMLFGEPEHAVTFTYVKDIYEINQFLSIIFHPQTIRDGYAFYLLCFLIMLR